MAQNDNTNRSRRGFAAMDEDQQREIASMGGKAAHEKGTAHEWDSNEARDAGQKGGKARQANQASQGSPVQGFEAPGEEAI